VRSPRLATSRVQGQDVQMNIRSPHDPEIVDTVRRYVIWPSTSQASSAT
jgi:hypothetical protein